MNTRAPATARPAFTQSWPRRASGSVASGCRAAMEVGGIYGRAAVNGITTTTRDRAARPAPDLVECNFSPPTPTSCKLPTSLTFGPGRAFCIRR
jgi:hypothetical protein